MGSEIIRDENYYMKHAIFLVEDTHFKVPTMRFEEESEVFKAMFTLPPPESGGEVEGQSDDKPIRLPEVKKEEFKSLVRLFYSSPSFAPLQFTPKEWVHILSLSTMYEMERVRARAITQIHKTQREFPNILLNLGKEFDVEDWIFLGVDMLVRREEPLNAEDVKSIGIDEVLKIASIRECCSPHQRGEYKEKRGQVRQSEKLDERIKTDYNLAKIPPMDMRRIQAWTA